MSERDDEFSREARELFSFWGQLVEEDFFNRMHAYLSVEGEDKGIKISRVDTLKTIVCKDIAEDSSEIESFGRKFNQGVSSLPRDNEGQPIMVPDLIQMMKAEAKQYLEKMVQKTEPTLN